jgi:hypothetical protein
LDIYTPVLGSLRQQDQDFKLYKEILSQVSKKDQFVNVFITINCKHNKLHSELKTESCKYKHAKEQRSEINSARTDRINGTDRKFHNTSLELFFLLSVMNRQSRQNITKVIEVLTCSVCQWC